MNKSIVDKLVFRVGLAALCGAAAFALPALAQSAPNEPANQTTPVAQVPASDQHVPATAQRAVPPVDSRMCVRETGSHLRARKGQCLPVAGNSYSRQDLDRTGAMNVGQALQRLDPSVRIGGH